MIAIMKVTSKIFLAGIENFGNTEQNLGVFTADFTHKIKIIQTRL